MDDPGIPLAAIDLVLEDLERRLLRHTLPVGAIGRHGVVCIGNRRDARRQRNLIALEPVGVALAVDALVVGAYDGQAWPERLEGRADVIAARGVRPNVCHFLIRELARLEEDRLLDADLADVVRAGRRAAYFPARALKIPAPWRVRGVAFAVNRDGPANLASACTKAGIPLIHISTDYVFDGRKKIPYSEYDRVSPLGAYGESKFAGEAVLKERSDRYIILRTAWVYGAHGNNFVKTMLKLGQKNEILRVVNDQFGCPTYAADVADVILKIALIIRDKSNIDWGTYHYCGQGVTSWCGFAESIFEIARAYRELKVKRVEPISTSEYHTVAQRPAYSVLDCSLIESKFQIRPIAWRVSLADVLKEILINKIFS